MDLNSAFNKIQMTIQDIRSKTRVGGIVMFDLVITYIIAYFVYTHTKLHNYYHPVNFYASLIPLSLVVHYLFNVKTAFYRGLFEDHPVNYYYWAILVVSLALTCCGNKLKMLKL